MSAEIVRSKWCKECQQWEPIFADDGLPTKCISSITVGGSTLWCSREHNNHEGLCTGSDGFGGHAEWRCWHYRNDLIHSAPLHLPI